MPPLPDIVTLQALCQSLALLDAILCPEWQFRYYSYNAHWSPNQTMASMRDGSGNGYFLLFTEAGAILKGFAKDSPLNPFRTDPPQIWPGILESVPACFADFLTEPAFALEETTFCLWRRKDDRTWQRGVIAFPEGTDPDGSGELLALLVGGPEQYLAYAEDGFETEVPLAAIEAIYQHRPLTNSLVHTLNPELSLAELQEDLKEIGYLARPR
jgi:hypothetical protein